jgi:hypothetical protein
MTRERARAHARVILTVEGEGPAALASADRARIRVTAGALLFCRDIASDKSARAAFAEFQTLRLDLVASGRWTAARARQLASDIWACGPGGRAAFDHS